MDIGAARFQIAPSIGGDSAGQATPTTGQLGYDYFAFAKLDPYYDVAINLLAEQVVPTLR